MGNRWQYLQTAEQFIAQQIGKIIQKSSVYETEPWGIKNQNGFLNQVLAVTTVLSAQNVLENLLTIEQTMGRIRSENMDLEQLI